MELTQIAPYGLRILEPVTSLTDLITATICFIAFFLLGKWKRTEPEHRFFQAYFLLLGLTTFFAGLLGHAFLYLLSDYWKMLGWICSGFGFFCIERSALYFSKDYLRPKLFQLGLKINLLKLFGFYGLLLGLASTNFEAETGFKIVQINSTISLIGIALPLHLFRYRKMNSPGSFRLLLAILAGIFPAITYNTQFTLHAFFNYHDISHVFMSGIMLLMYWAARSLIEEKVQQEIQADSALPGGALQ